MDEHEIARINNLRDQTFGEAYEKHDVGSQLFRDRLSEHDFQAFNHGDDKRDEDVHSGTGIDLGVHAANGERTVTCGWTEIKTKSSVDWLGRLNKEDWTEYRGFATYQDEPVFIYFCHVTDVDHARVGDRYFVRVPPMNDDDIGDELPFTSKGHRLVEIDDAHNVGWPTVIGAFRDCCLRQL